MKTRSLLLFPLIAAATLLATQGLQAQNTTQTWVGNNSTLLTDAANWSPSVTLVNTNAAIFGASGSAGTTINVATGINLGYSGSGGPALTFTPGGAAYTFNGTGLLTVATGGFTNNSSQTQTFNNPFRFNTGSGHGLNGANSAVVFNNTVTLNQNATFTMGSAAGQSLTFSGNVVATGGPWNFVFNGGANASTVTFSGSNTTGIGADMRLGSNVRVNLGAATALASTQNVTMNGAGATLANTSGSAITTNASLGFSATSQAYTFGDASHTAANNITFNGANAINADMSRTLTVNGTGVTISSASVWNNTVSGNRSLVVNGSGNTLILGGLAIGNSSETANVVLSTSGSANLQLGAITNGGGTGTRSMQFNNASVITSTGNNTYSGTTGIGTSATFLVLGSHIGGSSYSVGGILGGTGTINLSSSNGTINFVSGGTGRLQASSADTLTIVGGSSSAITLNNSIDTETGRLIFTLAAPGSTVVDVQGLLTIGVGFLDFDDFAFTAGAGFGAGTYTLFDYTTLSGSLGTSLNGTISGLDAAISLDTLNGAIVLNVVPEPSTWALLAFGAAFAVFLARRRRA